MRTKSLNAYNICLCLYLRRCFTPFPPWQNEIKLQTSVCPQKWQPTQRGCQRRPKTTTVRELGKQIYRIYEVLTKDTIIIT